MKDIVTFETSIRLKDAGFPQPSPKAGQFWYGKNREVGYIFYHERLALLSGEIVYFDAPEKCVFAPTSTDILRELGPLFDLSCDCGEFWCRDEKDWNPAEAVAEAWLKLNEKK